jgi:hypothetical protein
MGDIDHVIVHKLKRYRTSMRGFRAPSMERAYAFERKPCMSLRPPHLVSCPINSVAFVAIKMGRRSGSCRTRGGRISRSIRNRRATQPPAHFHRNPPGRGQLVVFPRCSLDPYEFRYGRFARALTNSQLIRQLPDEKPRYLWDRTLDPPAPSNRYCHPRSIAEPLLRCSCPVWVFRPRLRRLSFFWSKSSGHPFRSRASTI